MLFERFFHIKHDNKNFDYLYFYSFLYILINIISNKFIENYRKKVRKQMTNTFNIYKIYKI